MIREIKFRFWGKNTGDWFYASSVHIHMSGKLLQIPENIILMQYTGLKDWEGTEIYEGDLLVHRYPAGQSIYKAVIDTIKHNAEGLDFTYHGVHLVFISSTDNYVHNNTTGLETDYPSTSILEIVGNIYEHPHLIDGSKEA